MEENEAVEIALDLNVKDAEETLESFMKGMESLQDLAQNIGAELRKAFASLQASLQKTVSGIYTMTDALTATFSAIQSLMEQMANEQVADQWLSGIATAIESLALSIDVAKIIKSMGSIGSVVSKVGSVCSAAVGWITETLLPAITTTLSGIASALGISVGWVAAIIAAVVAAIAAVVIYWDEIKMFFTDTLPQLWGQFTQWLGNVGTAIAEAFGNAVSALGGFLSDCWNGITALLCGMGEWMQTNVIQPIVDIFTPIVQWFAQLFGSIWQTVTDVFYNLGVVAGGCWEIIQTAWGLAAAWFHENIIAPVSKFFSELWETVSTAAVAAWNTIKEVFIGVGNWLYSNVIKPVSDFFAELWNGFLNAAKSAWEGVKIVFGKVAQFFRDAFSAAWEGVVKVFSVAGEIFIDIKDGILTAFKKIVNGIITGINAVVRVPFNGINGALELLRGIRIFDIAPFSELKMINVPQIPYLAKGAVLPANKPFLAMVGDQRHGTNVEAPLATIQEAVAMTMEDFTAGNMAGHQATVAVLTQILEAVLGIQISDTDIGRAAERYRSKMAIARGSVW